MAHKPTTETRAQVSACVSFGVTQAEICDLLDITTKTLTKHYEKELKTGAIKANYAAARKLYTKAVIEGDTTCLIFWLKTRTNGKFSDASLKAITEQRDEILREINQLKEELNEKYKRDY